MRARTLVGTCLMLLEIGNAGAALAPRDKVSDYPAHLDAGTYAIAAEYLVHSFGNGQQMFFTPDFLVVEIAVFPEAKTRQELEIGDRQFSLRVNGKKAALPAQSGGQVAASLKYGNWNQRAIVMGS